ncbi:VOC family protein [Kitasatospora sp. NPDC048540]|uniref:VOC family protein n=1 Tax=unclassified Kitasatospora TaxID=2633591 RepID=UPI0005399B24|nr:VOC family protein [Kitasatospora sp. MBT63]
MITTDFATGSPVWLDLGAPDVDAAGAFYSAVFGWQTQSFGEDTGGFLALHHGGKLVGGIGRLTEQGARSAWMLYFKTADVDAAAKTVERLGGTVRVAPMDAGEDGRMGQFTDPQGGQFALWQQVGGRSGLEAVDGPGTLNWTELYTTDAEAAKTFYGELLGWRTAAMPMPGDGGTYWIITPQGLGQDRMQGGLMQLPAEYLALNGGKPYWHPVFAVEDCDATVATVTGNGGSVQMGPEDVPGVGRLAVCLDPAGADFVVLRPAPPAQG